MDPKKWEWWRDAWGNYWAYRFNTHGKVMEKFASAQARADWCDAWERDHPDEG